MVEAAGVPLGNVSAGAGEAEEISPLDVSIVSFSTSRKKTFRIKKLTFANKITLLSVAKEK